MSVMCIAVLILRSVAATAVQAVPSEEPAADPAHTLLREVASTYRDLDAYADDGRVVLSIVGPPRAPGEPGERILREVPKPFAFARPGRMAVASGPAAFVSDGERTYSRIGDRYHVAAAPDELTDAVLARDPAAAHCFGGPAGMPSMLLFRLLAAADPYRAILRGVERLELEPDRRFGDWTVRSLRIVPESGPHVRLLIDPATRIVVRVEILPRASGLPPGLTVEEISWTAGAITTGDPPPDRFAIEPPEGAERVDRLAQLAVGPDESIGVERLVGDPAPGFGFEVLSDGNVPGRLSKADLAGKVVLLEFWAARFGTSHRELPALARLVDRFAGGPAASEVRIVALSIDAPLTIPPAGAGAGVESVDDVREAVRGALRGAGADLDRPPVGLVALDPDGEAAEAFNVAVIPTAVLLDRDGVVRDARAVDSPEVIEELGARIDALLAEE